MKRVTLIIPIYNIEREYLTRCVDSVCSQTYDNLEVILVDDGSTDGTAVLCDELAAKWSAEYRTSGKSEKTVSVYHKVNGGSSSARNYGIEHASGEFLGFIDSDDYIDEDFVSLMMEAIEKNDLQMAQISRDEIAADGSRLPDVCTPPADELRITAHDQMRELLMHRGDCSFCTRLTAKKLFDGRSFPEGRLNEDFYLLIQMLADIDEYAILPKQAYHVFYRPDSNSRRTDKEDFSRVFIDIVDNADYAEKMVATEYPDLIQVAKRFALYQRLDYLLHIPISQMTSDNEFYMNVWKYLKNSRFFGNEYLTLKNKMYLGLLKVNPRLIRIIHRSIRRGHIN